MNPSEIALKIRDLSKSFGSVDAVKSIELEIRKGEIFGLLGPNGAGKSTTINMIAGITRIGAGEIQVFGYDVVKQYSLTRCLTGVMHQEIIPEQFFPIGKALRIHSGYYGVKDDPKWRELLIDRLDLGPHLKKRMIQLSGGMKRRFMVAKALIHRPQFLVLDEPTAGVDVELRRALWDFVREINRDRGTTILLTTHYLEEAEEMCGRIAIMNHGKIIAMEPTQELVKKVGDQALTVHLREPITNLPADIANTLPHRIHNEGLKIEFVIQSADQLTEIVSKCREAALPITDIETHRPDLEEVFVKLTNLDSKSSNMGGVA